MVYYERAHTTISPHGSPPTPALSSVLTTRPARPHRHASPPLQLLVQAEDRVHRIGQRFPVNVQYLLARGTVDEMIWFAGTSASSDTSRPSPAISFHEVEFI